VLALLAALLLAWLVAWRGESLILVQLLWPIILAASAWAGCGPAVARALLPALCFLYFATPLWDHLVPLLQWLTVAASERILGWLGIPFGIDGNLITLRDGTFEVAEGCAGKRYFVVTLVVATAMGVVERFPPRRLFMFMALAAGLAILMNWLRVVAIIVVGHLTAMQHYLVAVEHETFGWLLFGLLLMGVLWLGHVHRPAVMPPAESRATPETTLDGAGRGWWWPLPLLAAGFLWHTAAANSRPIEPRLGNLPVLTGDWQGPYPASDAWKPVFRGPAAEVRAAYAGPASRVEIYVNVYGIQGPGRELVGYANSLAGPAWRVLESPAPLEQARATLEGGPAYFVAGPTRRDAWVLARVFRIGGTDTATELPAQVLYGARALLRPVPAGVVAFALPCAGDCDSARARLEAFWAAAGPRLMDIIPADGAPAGNCSKLPVSQGLGEGC
jgi:EpsI family protein